MVTVGGIVSSKSTQSCDWESMGVALLDLTSVNWGSIFDSSTAPYQVNTIISDVMGRGAGANENATRLLPDGCWTSTGPANLFPGTKNQTTPYSPSVITSVTIGPGDTHATRIGAIIVGDFGRVVLLTLSYFSTVGSRRNASGGVAV